MPCCEKKRKEHLRRSMQRRLFESDMAMMMRRLKDAKPSSLSNPLLLDYHRKTHMLYQGAMKHKPPNKQFINQVVSMHDSFVKEMLNRGMKHTSPLKKI